MRWRGQFLSPVLTKVKEKNKISFPNYFFKQKQKRKKTKKQCHTRYIVDLNRKNVNIKNYN